MEELKNYIPGGDFVSQCLFQPLPRRFGQRSAEAGGKIMGVKSQRHNGVMLLACVMVRTINQEAFAHERLKAWVQRAKDFATTIENGNVEWTYLNYADPSQDPLSCYGVENE